MRKQDVVRLEHAPHAEGGVDEPRDRTGSCARRRRGASGRRVAGQAAEGFHRAVHERRPATIWPKKEAAEIVFLEAYLPAAADPALIERAVADAIAETGATSAKDMGRVMKAAMARLAGQTVDGKVSERARARKLAGPKLFGDSSRLTFETAKTLPLIHPPLALRSRQASFSSPDRREIGRSVRSPHGCAHASRECYCAYEVADTIGTVLNVPPFFIALHLLFSFGPGPVSTALKR